MNHDARQYDPLTIEELGRNAAQALLRYPHVALPPPEFDGVGVYTVHYWGDFGSYVNLKDVPIYVGKADRIGARTLHTRLAEHARSIEQAENLRLADFTCRWLILDQVWIGLTERVLISEYRPVWNDVVKGFGNHPPGSGRNRQRRSLWDELHPGRAWAAELREASMTRGQILAAIADHRNMSL